MTTTLPDLPGTVVFLQGTGGPDPVPAETIRAQLSADPDLSGYTVLNVVWAAGAASDISVVPALPPPSANEEEAVTRLEVEGGRGLALAGLDLLRSPALPTPGTAAAGGADVSAEEEELLGSNVQRLVLGLVTNVAVRRRQPLTEAASDFARSIIFYLRQGAAARSVITNALRLVPQDAPVILFGHSLGGVAAVDLLTDPGWPRQGLRVDLLVTAGSQSPWLYLLGGLAHLAPESPGTVPVPWLNFWDERDLLSFCAERVFVGRGAVIRDLELVSGEPFPASHGTYFADPALYRGIREELAAALAG